MGNIGGQRSIISRAPYARERSHSEYESTSIAMHRYCTVVYSIYGIVSYEYQYLLYRLFSSNISIYKM